MPTSQRTWTRLLIVLAVVFAILNTINAINKGGDAEVFFEGGRRFLHAEPLYRGSSAAGGFIGPPFQAVFFAPFAAVAEVSPVAAKLLWHALNLVCLGLGVWLSLASWTVARARLGLAPRPWLPMLFAPLVAVLLPLQTNFEHQNMNVLLLALIAAATWQLTSGSARVAGILIGTATALKAFPALLIVYLVVRREWTAALTAVVAAALLTAALPIAVYGAGGFSDLVSTFTRLSSDAWPIRGNNQSLIATLDRLTIDFSAHANPSGVRIPSDAPVATAIFAVCAALLGGALAIVLMKTPRRRELVPAEIATVLLLAILLAPIAWEHYWVLAFPAALILYDSNPMLARPGRVAFWIAALLMTGLSPLTIGRDGFELARAASAYTIAGIVMYVSMLELVRRAGRIPT